MGKIIFCAVTVAGLCFGQFIESSGSQKFPQPISAGWRTNRFLEWNNSVVRKLSFHQNPLQFNTILMVQTESETLQPKKSCWKQAGIYGVEFVGASCGTFLSAVIGMIISCPSVDLEDYSLLRGLFGYCISNMLITSSGTWACGKLMNQKGSWQKTALGSGVGALIGISVSALLTKGFTSSDNVSDEVFGLIFLTPPALGAVVGFNIK